MNTKKLALALFPLILAFASCMNMNSSAKKAQSVLPCQEAALAVLLHFPKTTQYIQYP